MFLAIAILVFGLTDGAVKLSAQEVHETCPRPAVGSVIQDPPQLRSVNGLLELSLHLKYEQTPPNEGPPRYCYITDGGIQSPTLRVHAGDRVIIHLHNDLPQPHSSAGVGMAASSDSCAGAMVSLSSTNLHFHGLSVPPLCHQDEVMQTVIGAGEEFDYSFIIPANALPGLYWYHPHPHGFGERQVQGGASGAIIVEGRETLLMPPSSLPERVLLLRDQQRIGPEAPGPSVPSWDISANFVPVVYPEQRPGIINMHADTKEFWRVVNASADSIFNLQFLVNGVAQPLYIFAMDSVPHVPRGSSELDTQTAILLPPGARAEFFIMAPGLNENGELITQSWDTGPSGDNDTKRLLAEVRTLPADRLPDKQVQPNAMPHPMAIHDQYKGPAKAIFHRTLYFSQHSSNPEDPDNFVLYYLTVAGQTPVPYKMGAPPNIVVHQGDVEEWTIENRSPEDHVFHIHQLHFTIAAVNGKRSNEPDVRDTVDVPYWRGNGPYPSVTLRMEFTDPGIVGTFLYHCHILKHEDMGMMGSVRVLPPGAQASLLLRQSANSAGVAAVVTGNNATGTIQFDLDGIAFGPPVPIVGGQARLSAPLPSGKHAITATYSGDFTYDESVASINVHKR